MTDDAADENDDRRALQIILTGVLPEMLRVLAAKDTAKTAWETIRTMRMGSERAREAKAQVRRREFEDLRFKDGESVEDFGLRLAALVAKLFRNFFEWCHAGTAQWPWRLSPSLI